MLELGSAGPLVARKKNMSVQFVVQLVGTESAAVGTSGVHRGAHLTFHTAAHKHTQMVLNEPAESWTEFPAADCHLSTSSLQNRKMSRSATQALSEEMQLVSQDLD